MTDKEVLSIQLNYKKVATTGGIYISETFYNPVTGDVKRICTRDYDYADGSRDIDALYFMPIDNDARRVWLHSMGIIQNGDRVKVVKGRKIPVGTVATVADIKPYKDRYGRIQCDYLYFTDGTRTNKDNCILFD